MSTSGARGITVGTMTIAVAGTAQQMPNVAIPDGYAVTIKAKKNNGGSIMFGGTKLEAESSSAFPLEGGVALSLNVINLSVIWIDTDFATSGVDYIVEKN